MQATNLRRVAAVAVGGALALSLAACGSSSNNTPSSVASTGGTNWASVQSAAAGGGMGALVAAAKKEGALNVITLPRDWANYGAIMDAFGKKYGIKITDANPQGSSGDEINAIKSQKGQSTAPDVVDIGNSYALSGAMEGLYAPYKVATWNDIPAAQKDSGGLWFGSYGGYVSIGCDSAKVKVCPTTFKQLDNPAYKGMVALNGDPTSANAAFQAVWATALANGGSATNIQPGIDFFKKLNTDGVLNKTKGTAATIASGATPIVLDWDYLNASHGVGIKGWKVSVPTDGLLSSYYDQAISATAPHPAAARLWEEFLYSQAPIGGQNLWIAGLARPIELAAMMAKGTAVGVNKLPKVTDPKPFSPTPDQVTAQKAVVTAKWATEVH